LSKDKPKERKLNELPKLWENVEEKIEKKLKTNCYYMGKKKTGKSLRFPALSKTKPQLMLFIEILEITNKVYCW
jgi:hypothetical protein